MQQHLLFGSDRPPLVIFVNRVLQCPATREPHGVESPAAVIIAPELMNGNDSGVFQPASDFGFAPEMFQRSSVLLSLSCQFGLLRTECAPDTTQQPN